MLIKLIIWINFLLISIVETKKIQETEFLPILASSNYSFIYFYSDNCNYCNEFENTYNNLDILYNNSNLQVLKVNRDHKLSDLCNISSYPTLSLLHYELKKMTTYTYNRDLELIIEFLSIHTEEEPDYSNFRSNLVTINNDFEVTEPIIIIFTAKYISGWDNYHLPTHFIHSVNNNIPIAIADINNNIPIAIADLNNNISSLLSYYQISEFPTIIEFKDRSTFRKLHLHSIEQTEVEKFISDMSIPWIENYNGNESVMNEYGSDMNEYGSDDDMNESDETDDAYYWEL